MSRPSLTERYIRDAERWLESFKIAEAEASIRQALKQAPRDQEAHAILAKILIYSQREEEAVEHLRRGIDSDTGRHVGKVLAEHFLCRTLMAISADRPDPKGFRLLDEAQRIVRYVPEGADITLSACIIAKNEAKNLPRCLASIQKVATQIVVIDTGSTDETVEIARSFGATIGEYAWDNDFSAARNASLELAIGAWALWIDADEELTVESADAIRQALVRPQYAGFNIPIVNFTEDIGDGDQFIHAPVRLFRMLPGVAFTGRIHEQVTPSLKASGLPFATLEKARLNHYGYRPSAMTERNKIDRTITMLELELAEDPTSSFQWFNLANAFAVAKRHREAEEAARTSVSYLTDSDSHAASVFQILTEVLEQDGRFDEALAVIEEAETRGLVGVQTEFTKASVLLSLGRYDEALEAIEICLGMEWPVGQTGDFSIVTYKRTGLHGQILAALGRLDEALIPLESSLKISDHPQLRWTYGNVLERLGRFHEALDTYRRILNHPGNGVRAQSGIGRCAKRLGKWDIAAESFESAWNANPEDVDAWIAWCEAAEALNDTPMLLRAYDEFAKKQEPSASILVNWGRLLAASGNADQALHCFSEAIKRNPDDANAYFNCGDLLYGLGQYADAAHIYESGLRRSPSFVAGWFVMGNALAQMGLIEGAQLAYRQCLQLDPTFEQARQNLSIVLDAAA